MDGYSSGNVKTLLLQEHNQLHHLPPTEDSAKAKRNLTRFYKSKINQSEKSKYPQETSSGIYWFVSILISACKVKPYSGFSYESTKFPVQIAEGPAPLQMTQGEAERRQKQGKWWEFAAQSDGWRQNCIIWEFQDGQTLKE